MRTKRRLLPLLTLGLMLCALALPVLAACGDRGGPPKAIAGFRLGADVAEHAQQLDMATDLPVWGEEYFRQVAVKSIPGYRSGYIIHGNCLQKGRILRIKLNYADESLQFFERVLGKLEDRYGRGEWRGDAFGTLRTWKWGFTDEKGDSISLILQYYSGNDPSYTYGNSIRLANRDAMSREMDCGRKADETRRQAGPRPTEPESFDWYLPW